MTFSTTPGSTGQIHRPQSRVLTTESRPVLLYTTPKNLFINDITTFTRVSEDLSAEFFFNVSYVIKNYEKEKIKCKVQLLGKSSDSFSS